MPPFKPTAVNVTGIPWQQGLQDAVIVTDTGKTGFTVIVMELDIAGFPVAQVRSEVNTQVMTSPFDGV